MAASAVNAVSPVGGQRVELTSEWTERSAAKEVARAASVAAATSSVAASGELKGVAEALTERVRQAGGSVNVGVESINGVVVFTVTDQRTGDVLRKIPSDEALRIAKNIDELTGILVDRME